MIKPKSASIVVGMLIILSTIGSAVIAQGDLPSLPSGIVAGASTISTDLPPVPKPLPLETRYYVGEKDGFTFVFTFKLLDKSKNENKPRSQELFEYYYHKCPTTVPVPDTCSNAILQEETKGFVHGKTWIINNSPYFKARLHPKIGKIWLLGFGYITVENIQELIQTPQEVPISK